MSKMTNKTIFLNIWSMFLILLTYAQDNNLKTQIQLLQGSPAYKYPLDSTGFAIIKNAKFFTKSGNTDMFNINRTNIHVVDFNTDGEKDIIYQENSHYTATVLLVKKGDDFIEIWNGPGALVDIKHGEKISIYIRSNAVGCMYETMLSELSIKNDNSFTENIVSIHSETELNKINKTLKRKTISGILRTQPIIDDTKKTEPCTGDLIIGNQLRKIENQEVTVIKKQNKWLLVVVEEKSQSIIGWVKK